MENTSTLVEKIRLCTQDKKLREGKYRYVYAVDGLVFKFLKSKIRENYGLFYISFPASIYTLLKFGFRDFNQFEYRNYRKIEKKIPEDLKNSFAEVIGIIRYNGSSVSISKLVTGIDGNRSLTLKEHGLISNKGFWERFNELEEFFLENNIPFFDLSSEDILVKRLEDGNIIPVLIDYKKISPRVYPFQPNLLLPFERLNKVKRKFSRVIKKYML